MKAMKASNEKEKNISYSSAETQKLLRIERMNALIDKGVDPFPSSSRRDFVLADIKFWFHFVMKFDFNEFKNEILSELNDDSTVDDLQVSLYSVASDFCFPNFGSEDEGGLDEDSRIEYSKTGQVISKITQKYRSELFPLFKYDSSRQISEVIPVEFVNGEEGEYRTTFNNSDPVTLAGRIKKKRTSGKIAFATVEDESLAEGLQFVFKKDLLGGQRTWNLNFRDDTILDAIISGKKTIETRALNPEEKDRYFGEIQEGDIMRLHRVSTGEVYTYVAGIVGVYNSLEDAWDKGLDLSKVSGDEKKYSNVSDLKKHYSVLLSPQYLNKIQTNGLVAVELKVNEKTNSLSFDDFVKLLDEGDYIEATGVLDYSQNGEPSLFVHSYKLLTKSLRPLPEDLTDIEQRYRQRYIDMRINPELRELFKKKSIFWKATRSFMDAQGFMEVIVPTMEHTTGGAEATPFVTHHNALDEDFYLRISSELHQKRMIVGGLEKIYDIDKNYRNEGIDDEHLQEYTQFEFYWAYSDYNQLMNLTEELIKYVILSTFGTLQLRYDETTTVDWSKPWRRIPYYDFVQEYGGIDLESCKTIDDLRLLATSLGLEYDSTDGFGRLIDLIYKKTARKKCIEPIWLIDQPVELSPLAKRVQSNPRLTQRAQLIAYGSELANGFSELNDPIDQLERFKEQQELRESGDDEAMMLDKDYITALEIGMPPTSGFGYSERLFSVLNRKSIRECTPFPLMRREEEKSSKTKTQVFHIVLLDDPSIEQWQYYNAISHLTGSLVSHNNLKKEIIEIPKLESKDGEEFPMDMRWGIVIKKAKSSSELLDLYRVGQKNNLKTTLFAKEYLGAKDSITNLNTIAKIESEALKWIGVILYGKKSTVEELTEGFEK